MTTSRTRAFFRAGSLALVLATAALGAQAQGHGPGPERMGGPMGGAMGGPGMGMGMMGYGFGEHMLDVVNATDAQRSQIDAIFKAARADLKAQHDANAALHTQMRDLFTATVVDAAAIEAVRAKLSLAHDAVSKRMTQAAVDAARVLTPEQRAKLADLAKKRAARMAKRTPG